MIYFWLHGKLLTSWQTFCHHAMFLTSWWTFWRHGKFVDAMICFWHHDKLCWQIWWRHDVFLTSQQIVRCYDMFLTSWQTVLTYIWRHDKPFHVMACFFDVIDVFWCVLASWRTTCFFYFMMNASPWWRIFVIILGTKYNGNVISILLRNFWCYDMFWCREKNVWLHDVFLTSWQTVWRRGIFFFTLGQTFWHYDIFLTSSHTFYIMTYFWLYDKVFTSWHIFDLMTNFWRHGAFLMSWQTWWRHDELCDVITCFFIINILILCFFYVMSNILK